MESGLLSGASATMTVSREQTDCVIIFSTPKKGGDKMMTLVGLAVR